MKVFHNKADARDWVWSELQEKNLACFPFPPRGRIPNFKGAKAAAKRLLDFPGLREARRIKCNPDSPQQPVREEALRRGVEVLVPTPRLTDDFLLFDPRTIPASEFRRASQKSHFEDYAQRVRVRELPVLDAVVVGSVAVTADGRRVGKGHGFADLEAGIFHALGLPPAPVFSTVHSIQVVESVPVDSHDIRLSGIATPTASFETDVPVVFPPLDWTRIGPAELERMPLLSRLKDELGFTA